jgi:hypothetical protein
MPAGTKKARLLPMLSENSRIDKQWLKARPGLAWVPGCCQGQIKHWRRHMRHHTMQR